MGNTHRALGPQFDSEGEPGFDIHGQGYLWPYKMPHSGTTEGDPGMPLYRGLVLQRDDHPTPESALHEILGTSDRHWETSPVGTKEQGTSLGRHWTHDQHWASSIPYGNAVLEAEHPGREHVMDWDKDRAEASSTIMGHEMRHASLPEVPIRGGAPMKIRAIHLPTGEAGEWERHPINYEGRA